ncbi:EndoU domain-containing protein, partial [Streptomyces sp. NPDC006649]|uniref:EndoU domain-containing protein n=1 Tax=Streptomyces sp. NPDC006649 TaxID=3156896 RepID=UPI0033AF4E11
DQTMFPDHWSPDEVLHATRQVYLDHVRTGTLSTDTVRSERHARPTRSGRRTFDGVYQGVRITGTADTTGTILDFAPHPDQSGLQPPTHLTPPPPREPSDEPAFSDASMRFLLRGDPSTLTGVQYAHGDEKRGLAQTDRGITFEKLTDPDVNGVRRAEVWFRNPPTGPGRATLKVGDGDSPDGVVQDGVGTNPRMLFPEEWTPDELREAVRDAHHNALANGTFEVLPEGGYLWEGVAGGVRMQGVVKDGAHRWFRPTRFQPHPEWDAHDIAAVTSETPMTYSRASGGLADFRVSHVVFTNGDRGLNLTRIVRYPANMHPSAVAELHEKLDAVQEHIEDTYNSGEESKENGRLPKTRFTVELRPAKGTGPSGNGADIGALSLRSTEEAAAQLLGFDLDPDAGRENLVRQVLEHRRPVPQSTDLWHAPHERRGTTPDPLLAADVEAALRRTTHAGLFDEPGLLELLAARRSQDHAPHVTKESTEAALATLTEDEFTPDYTRTPDHRLPEGWTADRLRLAALRAARSSAPRVPDPYQPGALTIVTTPEPGVRLTTHIDSTSLLVLNAEIVRVPQPAAPAGHTGAPAPRPDSHAPVDLDSQVTPANPVHLAAVSRALNLPPGDLRSALPVLHQSATPSEALHTLRTLAARLGAGPQVGEFVRRMSELQISADDWWDLSTFQHSQGASMRSLVDQDIRESRLRIAEWQATDVVDTDTVTDATAHELGVHPLALTRLADALRLQSPSDVSRLNADADFWRRAATPEELALEYLAGHRTEIEDLRAEIDRERFDEIADELLGEDRHETGDPDLDYHGFVYWTRMSLDGLRHFSAAELDFLVGNWSAIRDIVPPPPGFDLADLRSHVYEVEHLCNLAEFAALKASRAQDQAAYDEARGRLAGLDADITEHRAEMEQRLAQLWSENPMTPATPGVQTPPFHQATPTHTAFDEDIVMGEDAPADSDGDIVMTPSPHRPHQSPPTVPVQNGSHVDGTTEPPFVQPQNQHTDQTEPMARTAPQALHGTSATPVAPTPVTNTAGQTAVPPASTEIPRPSNAFLHSAGYTGPLWMRQFATRRTAGPDGFTEAEITVRIHLDVKDGVTPEDVTAVKALTDRSLGTYFNEPRHRLPNGDLLTVRAEFTNDPKQAHHTVNLHPDPTGNGPTNAGNWYLSAATIASKPHVPAHEIGHLMGLWDYYRRQTPGLAHWPVYDDHALMGGNYADPLFGRITSDSNFQIPSQLSPYLRVMPRDLLVLGTSIGAALRDVPRPTVKIPLDVRERVLRGNPRTGAIGLLAPHGAADRPRPVATGDRNPNGTYQAGTHPDGSVRTVFPDHWTLEETLYAVRQVYLREQATHRLTPTTSTPGIETGNYHFTGDYQGVRITGTADGTGTITDFAPHHDQTESMPPGQFGPPTPLMPTAPPVPPPVLAGDPAIGEGTLRFLTYGSTHSRTGVHYALPGTGGADAQYDQGVSLHPLWSEHPNGTRWAQVWFKDPNLRGRTAQAAANGTRPPLEWQPGDRETEAMVGADGEVATAHLLFPERWAPHHLWNAIVVAHRNARSNGSWVEVPEGGYLWEGVYDGVRMHGHVRDGEQLWVRPSSHQPPPPERPSQILAATAPVHVVRNKPDGTPAPFRVQRVIHQDGSLGMHITRVLEHPALDTNQRNTLTGLLPEIRLQLTAELNRPDPYGRRELSLVTFDVELSPTDDPTMTEYSEELANIERDFWNPDTVWGLMGLLPEHHQDADSLLLQLADQLPPVPQLPAGWESPAGHPHTEQSPLWTSDVSASLHRNTPAGLLEEPGVRGLLAQHRRESSTGPGTSTAVQENTGGLTGGGADRTTVAADALGLDPADLTSIEVVLRGSAPLGPALSALHALAPRLGAGPHPTDALVRRMSEIGAPLSDWWHFSSFVHTVPDTAAGATGTRTLTMADVIDMDLAEARVLYNLSVAHRLPPVSRETADRAFALGVHPRYLERLANALGLHPDDITSLPRNRFISRQALPPERVALDYRISDRHRLVETGFARDRSRFNTIADELLGPEPHPAGQRFRSFMHWSTVADHGLHAFTDHRLRELVEHWLMGPAATNGQVPDSFDPRAERERHTALLHEVDLAERSGQMPDELAQRLRRYKHDAEQQMELLDLWFVGGVSQYGGLPATPSAGGQPPYLFAPSDPHPQSQAAVPAQSPENNAPQSPADAGQSPVPTDPPPTTVPVPRGTEIPRPSDTLRNAAGHAGPIWQRQFHVNRTVLPNGVAQAEITVRIHLDVKDGVTAELLQATKDLTARGLDQYYNDPGHRLPNGDLLRVKAEFTDDAKQAHHTIALNLDRDGNGRSHSADWQLSMETLEANAHMPPHEIGHLMGLWDYYRDPAPGEKHWPVYDDHALMGGNYADPLFGRISVDNHFVQPGTRSPYLRVMPRDLLVLGTSIGAALRDVPRPTVK